MTKNNYSIDKKRDKAFIEKKIFNISTAAYAILYNRFAYALNIKGRYTTKQVEIDELIGKKTRPIVVLWSNKYHNKFLATCQSTSNSEWNKINSFKRENGFNFIKHEVLLIDKERIKNKNGIGCYSEKLSNQEFEQFINDWRNNKKHNKSWNNFISLKNKLENEANQNIIDDLRKKINN